MKEAIIGTYCNIGEHSFVENGAIVGHRVTIKNGVSVWDRVIIEDEVFVGPNVAFTNVKNPRVGFKRPRESFSKTVVGKGSTLGANATIVCGVTIGQRALIGAGSVVTRDVGDFALVMGNPARQVGWVCHCGERLPKSLVCRCGRAFALNASDGCLSEKF